MASESASGHSQQGDIWETIAEWLTFSVAPVALFPWILTDWDVPKRVALRRWWWVYLIFTALTAVTFADALIHGSLWPLVFIPFAHVVSALVLLFEVINGSTPGVGYGNIQNILFAGPYFSLSWLTICLATVRTRYPNALGLDGLTYPRDSDEYVLPMNFHPRNSEATAPLSLDPLSSIPYLRQGVSTAVIGETGSGKTSAIKLLAEQLSEDASTAVIVHDTSTTFEEYYSRRGKQVIRIGMEGSDVCWNLFQDINQPRDIKEIANVVFGEPEGNNPFHAPAQQVFEACVKYLYWEALNQDALDKVGHDDLIELVQLPKEEIIEKFHNYDELEPAANQIDPNRGKGADSVYTEMIQQVTSVFVGDFAADGDFSLRDYVATPSGSVLLFKSNPMETAANPMFRVMLNWAIKTAKSSDTQSNFILDEIDALPPIDSLSSLAARGRSEGAVTILGVQTVGQLQAVYGDHYTGILGNCPQGLYFRPGDNSTAEFIQGELGKSRDQTTSRTRSTSTRQGGSTQHSQTVSTEDRYPITSGELRKMDTGECIAVTDRHWWKGKLKRLSEVRDRLS